MNFHLIWIKEKNWNKYELDLVLQWWDEDFIRRFLWYRWVVIVSIEEFKDEPEKFWNIKVSITFENTEILVFLNGEDLWERLYFISFLWLNPVSANYIDKPISEDEVKKIISSILVKIKEENETIKRQQEIQELEEQKKYEESWIKEWLKIINKNIDHIEQLMKAWKWVISWSEMKELDKYLNEMKKIRLWTNFNKMANIVLDSNILVKKVEERIILAYKDSWFRIDENSYVSNIDVLNEYFYSNRISEKSKFQPAGLKPTETVYNMLWSSAIFLSLLRRDLNHTFDNATIDEMFFIVLNLIEYIVLCAIIVISLMRLFSPLLWYNFSLYLLPAMWLLWLLIYLLNNLKLKWIMLNLVWFAVLALIYWKWLGLLLNTFAL